NSFSVVPARARVRSTARPMTRQFSALRRAFEGTFAMRARISDLRRGATPAGCGRVIGMALPNDSEPRLVPVVLDGGHAARQQRQGEERRGEWGAVGAALRDVRLRTEQLAHA